jgi:hypothetical protein
MKLQVRTFTDHRTLYRHDLLFPSELGDFAIAPGACTCFGHGCTSTTCTCTAGVTSVTVTVSA